jgi:hypothetical protein
MNVTKHVILILKITTHKLLYEKEKSKQEKFSEKCGIIGMGFTLCSYQSDGSGMVGHK